MKKTILLSIVILACAALLVGGFLIMKNQTQKTVPQESQQDKAQEVQPIALNKDENINEDNSEQTVSNETISTENISSTSTTKEEYSNEEIEELLKNTKIELINKSIGKYEDAEMKFTPKSSTPKTSSEYQKVTFLTIAMEFPIEYPHKFFSEIRITGETATGKDGNPVEQTSRLATWKKTNYTNKKEYEVLIQRVGGEVDPSKVTIQLVGKNDVTVEKKFENNGKPVGFENAKLIDSYKVENQFNYANDNTIHMHASDVIVKLQGRYYMSCYYQESVVKVQTKKENAYKSTKKSFVLVPLEGGFGSTLTKDKVKLVTPTDISNTTGKLLVNENEDVSTLAPRKQTTIELVVTSKGQADVEEKYLVDIDSVNKTIRDFFKESYAEVNDGSGTVYKFAF